jgi:hypothetical protein
VTVHILATCRNKALLPATLMVFDTLRVGFPTARVQVYSNGNTDDVWSELGRRCDAVGAFLVPIKKMDHQAWVGQVISRHGIGEGRNNPMWLVDTDVAFWSQVEHWKFDTAIAGRQMPEFYDAYTRCVTAPRIHTCLLRVNPGMVSDELAKRRRSFNDDFGHNRLVDPYASFFCVMPDGRRVYYDTAAMLSYQVSATPFSDEQNEAFDHMNCGTYADVVEPVYRGILSSHQAVYSNRELLRGSWAKQRGLFLSMKEAQ